MALAPDNPSAPAVFTRTSVIFRQRFLYLLCSLFAFLLALPVIPILVARKGSYWPGILFLVVFSLIFLSAVNAVSTRRRTFWVAALLAGSTVLLRVYNLFHPSELVPVIFGIFGIAFLGLISIRLVKYVLQAETVTSETIYASLCAYIMFGLTCAMSYAILDRLVPHSFTSPMLVNGQETLIPFYFSFVTLTTLGYGDISPVKPFAQILCVLQAIIGQLYLVVLVARLVGLQIAGANNRKSAEN